MKSLFYGSFVKVSLLCLTLFGFVFCTGKNGEDTHRSHAGIFVTDFPNVLNMRGIPKQPRTPRTRPRTPGVSSFSDLGAWHGFALPDSSQKSFLGGFAGPYLIAYRTWLSQSLAKLSLYDVSHHQEIDLSQCPNPEINYYPGLLSQKLQVDKILVQLDLWFISNRSALVRANISNLSAEPIQLRIGWKGNIFVDEAFIESRQNGIIVNFERGEMTVSVMLPTDMTVESTVSENKKEYQINSKNIISLKPDKSHKTYMTQTVCFNSTELEAEQRIINKVFQNPEQTFLDNQKRWNGYLRAVLLVDSKWADQKEYQSIAVKAVETLITNWRSPAGELYHDGLFPSYTGFTGFWAWDSWKHSAALANFAPELAKNQIRAMFDYQDSSGMVADCIFINSGRNNWRDTKPPLASWAVWLIYEQTKDEEFIREMYPKLMRYHQWWYAHRDHDQNGLCEYGSTDGTRKAAAWESGMDNAVRFDKAKMVKNDPYSWSLNQESVDLNSYLYAEKRYLASMASVLGYESRANDLKEDAEKLKTLIQTSMFDEETGYFYDIQLESKKFIKIQGPEGWIPLWAGVATKEQAERVKQVMVDTTKFASYIPFPTLVLDHPELSPVRGYWRGPVWLDQAYFAIKALERYRYEKEAVEFTRQLFDRLEGLKNVDGPIRENYNPLNGKGLNARHFSWSAAHLLMLYQDR